ncbi:NAD binding domain of 6-phosphogluconate dehydrogenase family protein [Synechococcus sp. BIOS-E4-1]|uniref:NAD(P)-dependent oxidoreductase n=1 Tax=Synechococcus sp. BIOS-E4-1 TaxID=1400864 RepID=UPI0016472443|nr:NAD(P)-dependent oxidoreductase [Synechococcus sp. BIOS-E4-1]QNI56661.1 NAD binding domain of 6-phosphogluconate dehydrogenase family protein [Synechococcus sp. BIOS-E4-1]
MTGCDLTPQTRLACIGLGALGLPMAVNLQAAGYPLQVHTRSRLAESDPGLNGAFAAESPVEVVRRCRGLLLCVSDDAAVQTVLWGDQGAVPALEPGSLVIDCSTISPSTSRAMAQRLAERDIAYIDAPVTGGTEGAKAGTLTVLCGGETSAVERARPVLEVIGGSIHHFGDVGSGQQVKAINQVLVAGSYAAVAEAIALGEHLQLPMEQVVDALCQGAAGSWALQHRSQTMLNDDYPLGFKLALHHKDLGIALDAALQTGLKLPITEAVHNQEQALMDAGLGNVDVSALRRSLPANPHRSRHIRD